MAKALALFVVVFMAFSLVLSCFVLYSRFMAETLSACASRDMAIRSSLRNFTVSGRS